jgi:TetR/AcrR family transcriptional repressor of mexCD-oprJ operon
MAAVNSSVTLSDASHDARRRHDRERLLDATPPVLHDDPAATLDSVAAAAGLSSVTARRLFANREQLITAICERALDELAHAIHRARLDDGPALDAAGRLTAAILTRARTWALLGDEIWAPLTDERTARRYVKLGAAIDAVLERAWRAGELQPDVTPPRARRALRTLLAAAASPVAGGRATSAEAAASAELAMLVVLAGGRTSPPDPDREVER